MDPSFHNLIKILYGLGAVYNNLKQVNIIVNCSDERTNALKSGSTRFHNFHSGWVYGGFNIIPN